MHTPIVTIIIPVRNGESTIAHCLDSLIALDYPKDKLDIVVVDNDSTDRSGEIIARYPVRHVLEKRIGIASARNRGIKESRGELIASTDADCVVSKGWINGFISEYLKDDRCAGYGGEILPLNLDSYVDRYSHEFRKGVQRRCMEVEPRTIYSDLLVPFIMGANSCYRRDALESVGFYGEEFVRLEDVEIAIKLGIAKRRIRYAPDAVVYRKEEAGICSLAKKYFSNGYFKPAIFNKYGYAIGSIKTANIYYGVRSILLDSSRLLGLFLQGLFNKEKREGALYAYYDTILQIAYLSGMLMGLVYFKRRDVRKVTTGENPVTFSCGDDMALVVKRSGYAFKRYVLRDAAVRIWGLRQEMLPRHEIVDKIMSEYTQDRKIVSLDVDRVLNMIEERH